MHLGPSHIYHCQARAGTCQFSGIEWPDLDTELNVKQRCQEETSSNWTFLRCVLHAFTDCLVCVWSVDTFVTIQCTRLPAGPENAEEDDRCVHFNFGGWSQWLFSKKYANRKKKRLSILLLQHWWLQRLISFQCQLCIIWFDSMVILGRGQITTITVP